MQKQESGGQCSLRSINRVLDNARAVVLILQDLLSSERLWKDFNLIKMSSSSGNLDQKLSSQVSQPIAQ